MSVIISNGYVLVDEDYGFLINENDYNQLVNNKIFEGFDSEWLWNKSTLTYFSNCIFLSHYTFDIDNSKENKSLVYYPRKKKSYLLNTSEVKYFQSKYFSNFKILERNSEFYSFKIPFPEIYRFKENSEIQHDDRLNICVGRFWDTYKNIEKHSLRINTISDSEFQPVFQKDFKSIFNLFENYKNYLNIFMGVEPNNIKSHKLILPYYLLNQNELNDIVNISEKIGKEIHDELIRDNDEMVSKEYDKWFNSELNELNRQAFENDPDNYWNID